MSLEGLYFFFFYMFKSMWSLISQFIQGKKDVLTEEQWKSFFMPNGRMKDGVQFIRKVRSGGVHQNIRGEVWPFLLQVYNLSSTEGERRTFIEGKRAEYEILRERCRETKVKFESKKLTESFDDLKQVIRCDAIRANLKWATYSPTQAAVSVETALQHAASVGLKDCEDLESSRIYHASRLMEVLQAYILYDNEIGYCQGMSDLLSPLLAVIEDNNLAFWCFVGFMTKARENFGVDQVGISRQLNFIARIIEVRDPDLYAHLKTNEQENCLFAFRTVKTMYMRELCPEQILTLWEISWAEQTAKREGMDTFTLGMQVPPTENLLLYAVAGSVLQRRDIIMERCDSRDEILKNLNDMAGHWDVWKLIEDAHKLVADEHTHPIIIIQ